MKQFTSKLDVYLTLSTIIDQPIIVTGSTALSAYGLSKNPDEFDLDIIIHEPSDKTKTCLDSLFAVFGIPKEHSYMEDPTRDREIGKLISFEFPAATVDPKSFKVHVFYKLKKQVTFKADYHGNEILLSRPADIFLVKRSFGRKKDHKQLAQICNNILLG